MPTSRTYIACIKGIGPCLFEVCRMLHRFIEMPIQAIGPAGPEPSTC